MTFRKLGVLTLFLSGFTFAVFAELSKPTDREAIEFFDRYEIQTQAKTANFLRTVKSARKENRNQHEQFAARVGRMLLSLQNEVTECREIKIARDLRDEGQWLIEMWAVRFKERLAENSPKAELAEKNLAKFLKGRVGDLQVMPRHRSKIYLQARLTLDDPERFSDNAEKTAAVKKLFDYFSGNTDSL